MVMFYCQKIITLISLVPNLSTCSKRYEGTPIIRLFPILLILPRNSMTGCGSGAAGAGGDNGLALEAAAAAALGLVLFLLANLVFFSSNGSRLRSCLGLTTPCNASSMSFRISTLESPYFSPKSRSLLTISIDFTNDFLSSSIACKYSGGRLLLDNVTTCNIHCENRI
jgi:hypothetical protein